MGADKALLQLDGASMLARTIAVLTEMGGEVTVVGRERLPDDAAAIAVIADGVTNAGPLGGLEAGLSCCPFRFALAVSCDLPHLNADLLRYQLELAPDFEAVVPWIGGRAHPLHAVYAVAVLDRIREQLRAGRYRLTDLLDRLQVRWVTDVECRRFDPAMRSWSNVNTPAEWECVRA